MLALHRIESGIAEASFYLFEVIATLRDFLNQLLSVVQEMIMPRVFVLTNHKGVSENRHLLPITPTA